MTTTPDRTPFADWLHSHATGLLHLDPAAPLDDLEPLRGMLDGARVVALGEHLPFINEFAAMRQRSRPLHRCLPGLCRSSSGTATV